MQQGDTIIVRDHWSYSLARMCVCVDVTRIELFLQFQRVDRYNDYINLRVIYFVKRIYLGAATEINFHPRDRWREDKTPGLVRGGRPKAMVAVFVDSALNDRLRGEASERPAALLLIMPSRARQVHAQAPAQHHTTQSLTASQPSIQFNSPLLAHHHFTTTTRTTTAVLPAVIIISRTHYCSREKRTNTHRLGVRKNWRGFSTSI